METPKHYQSKIEPIDFILANDLNFIEGNIIKYIARYKKKNGLEDLLKGFEYYKRLIELVKNEKNKTIDNSEKNIATYNIPDKSDIIGTIYDHEYDCSVWVVKVSKKKVFAFSDKQKSREIIVEIVEKEEKLYSENIFIPETIKVFYLIDEFDYSINSNGEFWRFKTTDGIININYTYEN